MKQSDSISYALDVAIKWFVPIIHYIQLFSWKNNQTKLTAQCETEVIVLGEGSFFERAQLVYTFFF